MIYKLIVLTSLSLFLGITEVLPQDSSYLVELKQQLKTNENDTGQIHLLLEVSNVFIETNLDSAKYYAEKGLNLSKNLGYLKGEMDHQQQLGVISLYANDMEGAKKPFLSCLEIAKELDSVYRQVIIYRILGNIGFMLGEYPEGLMYYTDGLTIALEQNFYEPITEFYSNIGNLYAQTDDYERAYEYFKLSQEAAEEHDVTWLLPNSLSNMAFIEKHFKNYDGVFTYATMILSLVDSIPNTINFVPVAYEHLASRADFLNKPDSALYYYHKMLDNLAFVDELYYGPTVLDEVRAYRGIGESLLEINRLQEAEEYLLTAFDKAEDADFLEQMSTLAMLLSTSYEKSGDASKSLYYYKTYKATSDSLFGENKVRELTEVRMEYEFSERQQKQELVQSRKNADHHRKELLYIIIIGGVLFTLTFFILLYRLQRNKTKREELQKENLQNSLDYKNQELTSNVLYMLKKNELLIAISDKLKKTRLRSKASNKPLIDDMIREIEISSKEIGWEEFELRFKEIHADYYRRLNKKFPNLSSNEQRLCAFLRLNMSIKDISAITFQSYHSIVQARSRMRKKMGIDENKSLTAYISQL